MNILQPQTGSVDLDLERDYISNLPKNIKEEVLMKLPIKEAIRTSLLSTKWKYVWRSIPNLVFNEDCAQSELIKLVDLVLFVHSGPILQFKLISRHACNEAIARWMLILSQNGIKNLYINLDSAEECMIPSSFFSCLALEHVLISCSCSTIHAPEFFLGFKFLRTLRLFEFDLTGITIERLISSCPLLESLELSGFVEYGRFVIHAPNLIWLSITGEFGDLCLETPKLSFVDINLEGHLGCYMNFTLPNNDCKSNILRVLGSLSAIEELELCSDCLGYLAKGPIPEALPVPFYRLTDLFIDLSCQSKKEVAAALCLFKSAPNLKALSLLLYKEEDDPPSSLAQSFWEGKGIDSDLFNCLELVHITCFFECPDESILNVAKFVLSTAPVLEKLVIQASNIDYLNDGKAFMKKLSSFPRLSKMAKRDFV
ncbi:F-box/FBD/LRR-repeat protein At1g13570-like [Carex rostrata]